MDEVSYVDITSRLSADPWLFSIATNAYRKRLRWGVAGVPRDARFFTAILPRRAVGQGHYRVRLFGRSGGTKEPIDDYAFRVE